MEFGPLLTVAEYLPYDERLSVALTCTHIYNAFRAGKFELSLTKRQIDTAFNFAKQKQYMPLRLLFYLSESAQCKFDLSLYICTPSRTDLVINAIGASDTARSWCHRVMPKRGPLRLEAARKDNRTAYETIATHTGTRVSDIYEMSMPMRKWFATKYRYGGCVTSVALGQRPNYKPRCRQLDRLSRDENEAVRRQALASLGWSDQRIEEYLNTYSPVSSPVKPPLHERARRGLNCTYEEIETGLCNGTITRLAYRGNRVHRYKGGSRWIHAALQISAHYSV